MASQKEYVNGNLTPLRPVNLPQGHPVTRFYEVWCYAAAKRAEDATFKNPTLITLPEIIPLGIVFDLIKGEPPAFKYRMVGSTIVRFLGKDPTGQFFGYDLPKITYRSQLGILLAALSRPKPTFMKGELASAGNRARPIILGAFPGSRTGENQDQLTIILAPTQTSDK